MNVGFNFRHALIQPCVGGRNFNALIVILNQIGKKGGDQPINHMVCIGLVFLLLCVYIEQELQQKGVVPAVKGQGVLIILGVKCLGKVVGQDRFILQNIDKNTIKGAFADFNVNRAALWQRKNKMFDMGRNDDNIAGLHFDCLRFDPVPAFAMQLSLIHI